MKILLAEDTKDLNKAVTVMLKMNGYDVDQAYDGRQALDMVEENGYDAILLDIMMPKISGINVLKELRKRNINTPVLMLTAKAEIDDKVTGLNAGADDYLTKPFAMKELIARVNALTRRYKGYGNKQLSYGNITLNADSQELKAENSVRLSVRELEMMQALITNQDKPIGTDYLLEHVWDDQREVPDTDEGKDDLVWLYVKYLVGKLEYINASCSIEGERGGSFRLVNKSAEEKDA